MSDMGEGSQYAHDQSTIARLRAERDALREALLQIRDATHKNATTLRGMADYAIDAARKEKP